VPESPPQVGGVEAEHGAYIHERERPLGVVAEQPVLGLCGETSLLAAGDKKLLLKTTDGVMEYGAP
jgi:hypothetical protein